MGPAMIITLPFGQPILQLNCGLYSFSKSFWRFYGNMFLNMLQRALPQRTCRAHAARLPLRRENWELQSVPTVCLHDEVMARELDLRGRNPSAEASACFHTHRFVDIRVLQLGLVSLLENCSKRKRIRNQSSAEPLKAKLS